MRRLALLVMFLGATLWWTPWLLSQKTTPTTTQQFKKTEEPHETEEEQPEPPKPGGGPAEFKYLQYRSIGPDVGGRVCRSLGVPGDPLTYYVASASGGVWKSTDGGSTFKPIFDEQPVASIGSIAVAPSDHNVLYVGSGEANIRGNVAAGNGIYKSVDSGKTWKHVWKQPGQIGTIIVHPTNPDIAFAAVVGRAFGPNPERGVYRTKDGGNTWEKVLSKDPDTGASDVCFDSSNPHILFAGLWQARRKPWEFTSGGPGSGLYTSRDGGDTWKQLQGKGLPKGIWGKVGIAVAPSDSSRVYALIEAEKGGLYRSDNGGETWELACGGHYLRQRAWYYSTLTIDPRNPDIIWCPQVRMLRSIDGGQTFKMVKGLHHGDNHDIWIDPRIPGRMIASNDGGVDITTSNGQTWLAPPLPIAQFYHIAADTHVPYRVSGAMQDFGTASGPSNSLCSSGILRGDWHEVGGGEAGFTAPDPADPDIVYAGEYGGYISIYNHRTRQARNVGVYPTNPSGHGAEDLRYRFQWTAPIVISPFDPNTIYHAGNVIFKTTDRGAHWTAISPDLTRNDKSKQKWSGGPITGDNTGVEYYGTVFALAESPKQKDLLWAGSDDGVVHLSRDGGQNWSDLTKNIPDLPEWSTITCIEPSPFDAGTAYLVADGHRLDNTRPYLYKTTDFGATWRSLASKLSPEVYLHAVREDPAHQGLLYVGSERGVEYSMDDGQTWQQLKLNLPTVAVHDLVVKDKDLVVGTHGRSVWILDDLTPVRQMTKEIAQSKAHLFTPEAAIRYRYFGAFHQKGIAKNPPPGAFIEYYLKEKPKGTISLQITDSQGAEVITLDSKPEKPPISEDDPDAPEDIPKKTLLTKLEGLNRITWNLRYKGAEKIKGAKVDAGEPAVGPLANPGTYTLKFTVDGQTQSATLTIKPDPRVSVSPEDLNEQLHFALDLRDEITHVTRLVNELRSVRTQITERNELLKENAKAQPMIQSGKDLIKKLDDLEARMHNPKAEVTYDILAQRGGAKLYSILSTLYDFAEDSDGPPTQGMRDIYSETRREMQQDEAELKNLVNGDLAKINQLAKSLDVPNVIVPEVSTATKKGDGSGQ